MRIAITGATGFVGGLLCPTLIKAGHAVVALVRDKPGRDLAAVGERLGGASARAYDGFDVASTQAAIADCDAVINLAGENILGGRWTEAFLKRARASRIDTTRALVTAMRALDPGPRVLVSASAVGYYGPRPSEEPLDEGASAGDDLLAKLCIAWEAEALAATKDGVRVVCPRIGVVLGRGGGALAKLETPFKWGLGGRVASGTQVMSWIHVRDLVGLLQHAVENDALEGPLNATAPGPVTNAELTAAFAKRLGRPAFLPVPGFVLKLMFGKGASVLTTGQRVLPRAALDAGYAFAHPDLTEAFADLYPRD